MFGGKRSQVLLLLVLALALALVAFADATRPPVRSRSLLDGAAHQNSRLANFQERVVAKTVVQDENEDILAEEVETDCLLR